MILLNSSWQPIATGPCTIEFVNSSRKPKMLYVAFPGSSVTMKRLPPFSQTKLFTETSGPIEAKQDGGKTISCEVKEKR